MCNMKIDFTLDVPVFQVYDGDTCIHDMGVDRKYTGDQYRDTIRRAAKEALEAAGIQPCVSMINYVMEAYENKQKVCLKQGIMTIH